LLYFETSDDGIHWSEDRLLAAMPQRDGEQAGHYQVSGLYDNRITTTIWASTDKGTCWKKRRTVTSNSRFNHAYVRRPLHFKAPFCFFWSDGDAHRFSKSQLYFGDFKGNVWQLPYEMKTDFEKPVKVN